MISSWLNAARSVTAPLAGALLFSMSGAAEADHNRRVEVEISTPGIYTRFSTAPQWGNQRYYGYEPWRRAPVYLPGYWTYHPPQVYWRDDHRYDYRNDYRRDDRSRHHKKKHHDNRRDWRDDHDRRHDRHDD